MTMSNAVAAHCNATARLDPLVPIAPCLCVRVLQALKSGAVYYRFTGDESGIASSYKRLQLLDTYHGVPSGVFQADEHLVSTPLHGDATELHPAAPVALGYVTMAIARFATRVQAGNMPSHGTETCAVVEMVYSWNIVHETTGDALFADKAEQILYNAL